MGDVRHSLQFLFFLRVLVFVQLNVFAREATPDVSKGPGEEEEGGGVWRPESEGARNRRHIEREKNREVRWKVNRGEWLIRPGGVMLLEDGVGVLFFPGGEEDGGRRLKG